MSSILERLIPGAIERTKTEAVKLLNQEAALMERRQVTLNGAAEVDLPAEAADDMELAIQAARFAAVTQEHVRIIENAIVICRLRRVQAITRQRKSEAAELREKAAELHGLAAKIRAKAEPLLAKLGELQGVPYDLRVLELQPNTTVFGGGLFRSRSAALDYEAAALEDRADALDKSQVVSCGVVTGDLEQALAAEAFSDPAQLAPPAYEIQAWVGKIQAQIEKEFGLTNYQRKYRLEWRDGKIDLERSFVEVQNEDYNRNGVPTFRVLTPAQVGELRLLHDSLITLAGQLSPARRERLVTEMTESGFRKMLAGDPLTPVSLPAQAAVAIVHQYLTIRTPLFFSDALFDRWALAEHNGCAECVQCGFRGNLEGDATCVVCGSVTGLPGAFKAARERKAAVAGWN